MVNNEVNCAEYIQFLKELEDSGPSCVDTFLEYSAGNFRATEARGNLMFLKEHFSKVWILDPDLDLALEISI